MASSAPCWTTPSQPSSTTKPHQQQQKQQAAAAAAEGEAAVQQRVGPQAAGSRRRRWTGGLLVWRMSTRLLVPALLWGCGLQVKGQDGGLQSLQGLRCTRHTHTQEVPGHLHFVPAA